MFDVQQAPHRRGLKVDEVVNKCKSVFLSNLKLTSRTLLLSCTGISMIYSPENMKLINRKQKVLVGGKQFKDNT